MNASEGHREARARRACIACCDEVEECACCEEPACPRAICYGCLRVALGEMVAPLHPHAG